MERRIRSFETLSPELLDKLQEQYPEGIDNDHIRLVNTPKGESLRVIELRTPEVLYLIKINPQVRQEMDEFLEQEEDDSSSDYAEGEGLEVDNAEEEEEEDELVDQPDDDEDDDDE